MGEVAYATLVCLRRFGTQLIGSVSFQILKVELFDKLRYSTIGYGLSYTDTNQSASANKRLCLN